ncbi:sensor histidine kinase [Dyella sp. C9]|uniref:sensor histidine kinase n=1 Tax=Dyella sp. C9 TaxID=2202154 RepID=UPI0018E57802|nr:sensor histidine kinase [Dyella sp. C9]
MQGRVHRAAGGMGVAFLVFAASLVLAVCARADGIPAPLGMHQWLDTSWTFERGAPGQVSMLHQSPDGFLWLSAAQSLYRFDGVRFERFLADDNQPISATRTMIDAPDGSLWIGLTTGGIVHLQGRHAVRYAKAQDAPYGTVSYIAVDPNGRVWAASNDTLHYLDGERWKKADAAVGYPGGNCSALLVDRDGTLWATTETSLLRKARGDKSFVDTGIKVSLVYSLFQAPDGKIWAAQRNLVGPLATADGRPYEGTVRFTWDSAGAVFARDGTLWLSTLGDGLKRIYLDAHGEPVAGQATETFTAEDGLSADYTWPILQDREGNIWVGTSAGLDRLRPSALARAPFPSNGHDFVLAPDTQAGVIAGTTNLPLMRLDGDRLTTLGDGGDGPVTPFRAALRDERGTVWLGSDDALWRWQDGTLARVAAVPAVPGMKRIRVQGIASDHAGGAWVSIWKHGLWHWHDGTWTKVSDVYAFALAAPSAGQLLALGRDGLMVYDKGVLSRTIDLSSLKLFDPTILSIHGSHTWIGGQVGWGVFDGKNVRAIHSRGEQIWGIAAIIETPEGDLWIDAVPAIFHVPAAEVSRVLASPDAVIGDFTSYNYLDGLPGRPSLITPIPGAVRTDDGKLWFATSNGVAFIDPGRIPYNPLPPPLSITAARIDGKDVALGEKLVLPRGAANLEIDFSALSLTMPERVKFMYKLVGWDQDWQDVGTRRTAYYGRLTPGSYRFVVRASNNDGVWNNQGVALGIEALPLFYQTLWFKLLCVAAFIPLVWLAYRARFLYLERSMRDRLEVQHAERERIARDLHDTLLQSVQGLVMHFQSVAERISSEPEARKAMDGALDRADKVVAEARGRVLDLRSDAQGELHEVLRKTGMELTAGQPMRFRALIEGRPRELSARVYWEVLAIAKEAMFNAFQHSNGTLIESEIAYLASGLRVRLRDDGIGLSEALLQDGRSNHWGLTGMRERADKILASFRILSREREGCEIEVMVPARLAYVRQPGLYSRLLERTLQWVKW